MTSHVLAQKPCVVRGELVTMYRYRLDAPLSACCVDSEITGVLVSSAHVPSRARLSRLRHWLKSLGDPAPTKLLQAYRTLIQANLVFFSNSTWLSSPVWNAGICDVEALNVDARFCLATSIEQLTSKRGLDSLRIEVLSSNSNLLRDLTVELQSRPLNLKCG